MRREYRMGQVTTTKRERFEAEHPGAFFLDERDLDGLERRLVRLGWLEPGEAVQSAVNPGDGNMNYTLRVTTSRRSLIVKQARPWVEKYDHISAPTERAVVEGRFYELVAQYPELRDRMPRLIGMDAESRLLGLEDLGTGADFTSLYQGATLAPAEADELATFLAALHREFHGFQDDGLFTNRAMRELNHLHIFRFPLDPENGLNLDAVTPGLSRAAASLQADPAYVAAVAALGDVYLRDGGSLAHGDFFPGSWLQTPDGPRVIDPEFCFLGSPEFDLGVMVGHLHLAGQSGTLVDRVLARYDAERGTRPSDESRNLVARFGGAEIMRRLIGVAQLPLAADLARKEVLLARSQALILAPAATSLSGRVNAFETT